MAEKTLHLSVVDQIAIRSYSNLLLIFPFPDESQAEAAVQLLTQCFHATVRKFPFLAGTLGPAHRQSKKLSLTYPADMSSSYMAPLFASRKLTSSEFPYTYNELQKAGMPTSVTKGHWFFPDYLRNKPGVPADGEGTVRYIGAWLPVLVAQAFFIHGGLFLSFSVHHTAMDYGGINLFWDHFARYTIASASIPGFPTRPIADVITDGPYVYEKILPAATESLTKVFVIPAQRICDLKQSFPNETRPTAFEVLAALIWIHVTRARASHLNDCKNTCIGIVVDLRRRIEPNLSADYMGNMALLAKANMPAAEFTGEDQVTTRTIIPAVHFISKTIARVDGAWVDRHLAFIKDKTFYDVDLAALGFEFGPDIVLASWSSFGFQQDWRIPGVTSTRPEYIRHMYSGKPVDGGMAILPRSRALINGKAAPYEVMISLAAEDMGKLVNEKGGLGQKWAERIID